MVASVKVDMRDVERLAERLGNEARKQIPFAAAKSLTRTAQSGHQAVRERMKSVFQGLTPFIRDSVFVKPATKTNLEATVGIRDTGSGATPAHYMKEHINAGERGSKPMEIAMRSMGILPTGWLAVPSKDGVKRDAYGNVSKATVSRILGALMQKTTARKGGDSFRLFVVRIGNAHARTKHLAPGIWSASRIGGQTVIKPVFLFVQEASYRKVLDLQQIVGRVVEKEFDRHFAAAFDDAMRTAL